MGKEQSATGKDVSVARARDGEKYRDRERRGKDIRNRRTLALGKAGMPFLVFNSLRTESEQSEHKGLLNLMKEIQIVEESAK